MYDVVLASSEKIAKHAIIDWDLTEGEFSKILIVSQPEVLEGLDPSEFRVHYASRVSLKTLDGLKAMCKSRGVKLSNITVLHNVNPGG